MFTHVVLFSFPTLELAAEARDKLLAMDGKVAGLMAIECGVDTTRSARSAELALITRHVNETDYAAYQADPDHGAVKAWIGQHATGATAVDFSG